jgi:hypothetical protein
MPNTRSRSMPLDSEPVPLEGRRLMKFDPTINTGTIVQIAVVVASAFAIYTGIRTDQVETKAAVKAVETLAATDRTQTKDALSDLKSDIKELQKSTSEIKESLAILRGRAAEPGSRR